MANHVSDLADGQAAAPPTDAEPAGEYGVFLSYHSPDRQAVRTIQRLLRARGVSTFLDREQLSAGLPWPQALEDGLRRSRAVAVFLGREELGVWQKREMWYAVDRQAREEQAGRRFPVIPVLLEGTEPAAGFLFLNTWIDLRDELTDPEALDALVRAVLGQDGQPQPGQRAELCPYRGLQVFHEEEAAFFAGRAAFSEELRRSVSSSDFVCVVGTSGSGKSSVVQAGLLPLLRRLRPPDATWDAVVFRPSVEPFHSLATELIPLLEPDLRPTERLALAQRLGDQLASGEVQLEAVVTQALKNTAGTDRLLIVVDQFEEVFTITAETRRTPFVDALLSLGGRAPASVVLTLRADFYGHAIRLSRSLSDRLGRSVINLGPMRRDELEQAIVEPARRTGLTFEPGLVETILNDVGDEPGSLPLLEHALLEVWNRRRGRVLSLEAYRACGGVEGALAKRAEDTYRRLTPEQQVVARSILLRLTQLGEGTEDTRRRATYKDLITHEGDEVTVDAVVRTLSDNRLLTTGAEATRVERWVDVSHEALIRGWPELRLWLDENRDAVRVLHRLSEAAHEWERLGRDEGGLYRGARLAEAAEWRATQESRLNELERGFLDASLALREREELSERTRQAQALEAAQKLAETERERAEAAQALARSERDARKRQLNLIAGLVVLLAVAIGLAALAVQARNDATNQQSVAYSRELAAGAISRLSFDPELSLLLAVEAMRVWRTTESISALEQAVLASHVRVAMHGHTGALHSAVYSPDGTQVVTSSSDGTARIWDAASGRELRTLRGHTDQVVRAEFSPNQTRILTAGLDATARVWDAASGQAVSVLTGHAGWVRRASFSPDGTRVVTASADMTGAVWDAASGQRQAVLQGHTGWLSSAVFSPEGSQVLTGSDDGTARIWDAATGKELQRLETGSRVRSAVYSPDGTRIAVANADGTVRVWDAATGQRLVELAGHTDGVDTVVFSTDGARLVSASSDATARVWDVSSSPGQLVTVLRGHAGALRSAVFSPDGSRVSTASQDGTARIWDARSGQELVTLRGHSEGVATAAFSPDGERVLTAGGDGTARVWDAGEKQDVVLAGHTAPVSAAAFNADGGRIVSASDDGTAAIWDTATGQLTLMLRGHTGQVNSATFSPDGARALTAGADGTARVWDVDNGQQLLQLQGHLGWVSSAIFSADGRFIATAGGDGTARTWDASQGQQLALFTVDSGWLNHADFSQDDAKLVTAGRDGLARVWDAQRHQLIAELRGHAGAVERAVFTRDGASVLTASADGTARVWDATSGKQELNLQGHAAAVRDAAFDPTDRRIVTASADGTARVWDANSGKEQLILKGHLGPVVRARFSADGARLVTAGEDRTARVWDAATGLEVAELAGHSGALTDAMFSPDGSRVVTSSIDGTALVHGCDLCRSVDDLATWVPARLTRELTSEERRQYLHEDAPRQGA